MQLMAWQLIKINEAQEPQCEKHRAKQCISQLYSKNQTYLVDANAVSLQYEWASQETLVMYHLL